MLPQRTLVMLTVAVIAQKGGAVYPWGRDFYGMSGLEIAAVIVLVILAGC